jgi:hypothetical protein
MKTRSIYRLERIESERPGQAPLEQLLPEMRALIHECMAPLDKFALRLASRTLRTQWCDAHSHKIGRCYTTNLCAYLGQYGTPDLLDLASIRWSQGGENLPRFDIVKSCIKHRNRDLLTVFVWSGDRIGYQPPGKALNIAGYTSPETYHEIIKHLGRWGDNELLTRFAGMCHLLPTVFFNGLCRCDHYHHLVRNGHLPSGLPRATRNQKKPDPGVTASTLANLLHYGSRRSLTAIAEAIPEATWAIAWIKYMENEPRQYSLWVLNQGWPHTPSIKDVFNGGLRFINDRNISYTHYRKVLAALAHLFHRLSMEHVGEVTTTVNQTYWPSVRYGLLRGCQGVGNKDVEAMAVMFVTILTPTHLTDIMRGITTPNAAPVMRALVARFRDTHEKDVFHDWLQAYMDRKDVLSCYSWPEQPYVTHIILRDLLDYPVRIDPTRAIHLPTVQDYMSLIRGQRIHTTEPWAYSMGLLLTARHSSCWDIQVVGPLLEEIWARHGKPRATDPLLLQFIQCNRSASSPGHLMWFLRVIFFLEHACGAYPLGCLDYKDTLRSLLKAVCDLPEHRHTSFLDEVYAKNSTLYWRYRLALLTSYPLRNLGPYDASASNPVFYTQPHHPITPEAIEGWRTVCYVPDDRNAKVPVNLRLAIFANLMVIHTGQPVPHELMARLMVESRKRIPLLHPQCCPIDFIKTIKAFPQNWTHIKFIAPVVRKFPMILATPEDIAWMATKFLESTNQ